MLSYSVIIMIVSTFRIAMLVNLMCSKVSYGVVNYKENNIHEPKSDILINFKILCSLCVFD